MDALLRAGLQQLGLAPSDVAVASLLHYCDLLLEQNRHMNLTAITDPFQVVTHHFLDCAALLPVMDCTDQPLLDVGTGAGLPGLVLKLLSPGLPVTLLDSRRRRVEWLDQVCRQLAVPGVSCLYGRAEELSLSSQYREQFHWVTSRAVAPLNLLCELCLPLVRPGGCFLAMKAVDCDAELAQAAQAIHILSGRLLSSHFYTIPQTEIHRQVVRIEKAAPTPPEYPRRFSKMQKRPL